MPSRKLTMTRPTKGLDAAEQPGTVFFMRKESSAARRWALRIGVSLALTALLALLGLGAVMHVARVAVLERIAAVSAKTDRVILVRSLHLGLDGLVSFEDVRVSSPGEPGRTVLSANAIDARIDLRAALAGSRRPTSVTVRGLGAELAFDGKHLVGLSDLREALRGSRDEAEDDATKPRARLPRLELEGATVHVTGVGPASGFDAEVEGLSGTLESDADDPAVLRATAHGVVHSGERSSGFVLDATVARGEETELDVRLDLDAPVELPPIPKLGPRRVRFGGLVLRSGEYAGITRVEVLRDDPGQEPVRELAAEQVQVELTGGGVPSPEDITAASVQRISARRGDSALDASSLTVHLDPAPAVPPPGAGRFEGFVDRARSVTVEDLHLKHEAAAVDAKSLDVELSAAGAGVRSPLDRLTRLQVRGLRAVAPGGLPALDAAELDAKMAGFTPSDPLAKLQRLRVSHPRLVLEAPDDLAGVDAGPLSPLLQALFGEDTEDPLGEGALGEGAEPKPTPPTSPPAAPTTPTPSASSGVQALAAKLAEKLGLLDVRVSDGEVALRDRLTDTETMRLSGIDAVVAPGALPGALRFDFATHLTEEQEHTAALRIAGELDPNHRLTALDVETAGKRLAQLLPQLSPKIHVVPDSEVSFNLHYDPGTDTKDPSLDGKLRAHKVGIDYWRIAHVPVMGLNLEADLLATYNRARDEVTASITRLRFGEVTMKLDATVEHASAVPKLDLHLTMPKQSCDGAARSLPRALIPRLAGLTTTGTIWFDLKARIDMKDPYSFKLDLDGDLESCSVLDIGGEVNMNRLNSKRFKHRVVVGEEDMNQSVGPGSGSFVPLSKLPTYVGWAAIATEDLAFYEHNGFRLNLIKRAVKLDLDKKRYVYGGSTISQQLVKNLFLSREKTLSRKAEEAILTWYMEQRVEKNRILELYLNCIEYGPEIWGVKRAAKAYFNKRAEDLTPVETAFLMGLKPCPKCGFNQYRYGGLDARWQHRVEFILTRLRDRGWITQDQFEASRPFLPAFYYPESGLQEMDAPRPTGVRTRAK